MSSESSFGNLQRLAVRQQKLCKDGRKIIEDLKQSVFKESPTLQNVSVIMDISGRYTYLEQLLGQFAADMMSISVQEANPTPDKVVPINSTNKKGNKNAQQPNGDRPRNK